MTIHSHLLPCSMKDELVVPFGLMWKNPFALGSCMRLVEMLGEQQHGWRMREDVKPCSLEVQ